MSVEIHCVGCGEPATHRDGCAVVSATTVTPAQLVAWYHVLELVGRGQCSLLLEPAEKGARASLTSECDDWRGTATGKVEQLGCELVVQLRARLLMQNEGDKRG